MKPSCARVLTRLQSASPNWVRGVELAAPDCGGLRFGGRLHELRAMGHRIERRSDPRSAVDQYRWLPAEPVQMAAGL